MYNIMLTPNPKSKNKKIKIYPAWNYAQILTSLNINKYVTIYQLYHSSFQVF